MNKRTPWFALIICLGLSVFATLLAYHITSNIAQERFESQVKETALSITARLEAYEQVLSGGKGLFATLGQVTRNDWKTFVLYQSATERFPGIQGVGYSEFIGDKENLEDHIAQMRQEFPDYIVRPEGDREEYHAIIYLEPFDDRNKRAFGYDMRSEPTRQTAMDLARDTGLTTLSGKVKLVQETESDIQAGFLMYAPIYKNGKQIETTEQRRDAFKGFVYAPFRMNNFMAGILGATQQDITFVICDVNADPQNLMYDYSLINGIKNDEIDQSLSKSITINTNQRQWVLKFTALKSIHSQLEILVPTLVLLTGILLSILLFFTFRTYYRIITLTRESI